MNWKRIAFVSLLFWLWYTWPTEGQDVVTISVYPKICIEPCSVRLTIHVPRNSQNRQLAVYWMDTDYIDGAGSSQYDLDGDSQTVFERLLEDEPASEYTAGATVWRIENGKLVPYRSTVTWTVAGEH